MTKAAPASLPCCYSLPLFPLLRDLWLVDLLLMRDKGLHITPLQLGVSPDFAQLGSQFATDDPTKLLPALLDQLTALGETARQLSHVLGSNGHRPEKLREVIQQLANEGDIAGNE